MQDAMITDSSQPRLRPLELKWLTDGPEPLLFLRDPTGVAPHPATVHRWVAVILGFCDGERDLAAIAAAFEVRTGQSIPLDQLRHLFEQLDEALFLDSPHYHASRDAVLRDFREAAFRPPALADRVYSSDPSRLVDELAQYSTTAATAPATNGHYRGVVSPHIDYQRGGPIYAETWRRATEAVNDADVVVVFGTDHAGGAGKLTLTRQSFGTPFGVLPTAVDVVDEIADAIGPNEAFEEELHHRKEHSIELAAVWLHHARRGPPPRIVPVLCGSFHRFTAGLADPSVDQRFERALDAIKAATDGQRVLVVAAGDLAHVGPEFGDDQPLDRAARDELEESDRHLLTAVANGDPVDFFGQLRGEQDRRRICGLPPIYLTLRLLGQTRGEVVGYDQCPADATRGSFVSIAGVLLE
jgi:AmmeMemoRadiSam system protein B